MQLYIKYMVSLRCKIIVKQELTKLGLMYTSIELGTIELQNDITEYQKQQLKINLLECGLELVDGRNDILIDKITTVIIELINQSDDLPTINYSDYISKKLNYDYTYLSNTFSQAKGITIQQFIIKHKIEKVKEWLLFGDFNLTEIAYKLHYSSVAHLSNQFKKVMGCSPSVYKQQNQKKTFNLENM